MEKARPIVAVFIGIIIIVVLILVARWTGDKIREKFIAPKKAPVVTQTVTPVQPAPSVEPVAPAVKGTTVKTIPSTGPADLGYYVLGLIFISGLLAKKYSSA